MPKHVLYLGFTLFAFVNTGCGSNALIVHQTNHGIEKTKGVIVAGDKDAIYVEPSRAQAVQRIEKNHITLLRHPGESKALPAITLALGLVAAIAGGFAFFDALAQDDDSTLKEIQLTGGGIAMGVGVVALGVGIPALLMSNASESASIERMQTPPQPAAPQAPAPHPAAPQAPAPQPPAPQPLAPQAAAPQAPAP